MGIQEEVSQWGGKSKETISTIYDTYHVDENFTDLIIKCLSDPGCQKGMSWLLKAYLEAGNSLEKMQVEAIYNSLAQLTSWESKLHILQSLPYLPIAKEECKKVELFLRDTLIDKNKFVRAWSYNGFYVLAKHYPVYMDEVRQLLEMAMRDEAASVKARVRNILKAGF